MRVSKIRVNWICVNQGLGVFKSGLYLRLPQKIKFFTLLETFSSRIPEKKERRKSKLYNNALGTAYKN